MPIYQRPNSNIKQIRTFSGVIKDSLDNPIEGATVVLRRVGARDYVRHTNTDVAGAYNFDISADGDFEVAYVLSENPSGTLVTTGSVSPGVGYSWYSGGGYVAYQNNHSITRLSSSSLYAANGGGHVWKTMPKYRVIDTNGYTPTDPFSGGVVIGSYTETGIGEGARVKLDFAVPGDTIYSLGGNPREYTAEEVGFGGRINKVTVTSVGRGYQTPILWISGTTVQHRIKDETPQPGEYAVTINSVEYWALDNSTTIAYSFSPLLDIPSYVQAYASDYAQRIKDYYLDNNQTYGENYVWGTWPGTNIAGDYVQGARFAAVLPNGLDRTDYDTTPYDNSVFINGMSNPGIVKRHGMQVYYVLIYGAGGTPSSPVAGGFVDAYNKGLISLQELDMMKGYLGRHFYVAELSNALGQSTEYLTDCGNFFYQMTQAVETTVNNAGNGAIQWTAVHPDAVSNNAFVGYLQYYAMTFVDLMKNIANEYQSWHRQSKGTAVSTSQYEKIIYPIFQKAGITSFSTTDGTTTRNYSVSNSNITFQ